MLIMYLGASPILALKSHILSEVHFIGKTGGVESSHDPVPTAGVQWSWHSLPPGPSPRAYALNRWLYCQGPHLQGLRVSELAPGCVGDLTDPFPIHVSGLLSYQQSE